MCAKQVIGIHPFPPLIDDVINGYKLEEYLKQSNNCVVLMCHHISDPLTKYVTKIAIKREAKKLLNEINFYEVLCGGRGIPRLIFHKSWLEEEEWFQINWSMIVIEKFCPRFAKTTNRVTEKTLTLEELVPMAVQQISLLEYIHSKGVVHRGIKPDNFVMSEDNKQVFIIDFNKSKYYRNRNGVHIDFQRDAKLPRGLPLFHSLNYHNGIKYSRRDDMESLGFCWIYLLKGSLPWSHLKNLGNGYWPQYVKDIKESLINTTLEELCRELPQNSSKYFEKYFEICRNLEFNERPDYYQMRQFITNSLKDSNNNLTLNNNH